MAKLYFYYSAMNAGKSTTLLQAHHNYIERGMETLLFAPRIDHRFPVATIYSRIGIQQPAISFDVNFSFFDYVLKHRTEKLSCLLVDEVNFLSKKQVEELSLVTTSLNIPVLCYGLRTDFQGEPFEGSRYLLAWADELVEIKTICTCGRKATMNLRIDEEGKAVLEGQQIQIGGNESYLSQCMMCYRKKIAACKNKDSV